MSPLPPSLQGLPTGKLIGSGGAVTPAAVGPPTPAGTQWQSRPLLFSGSGPAGPGVQKGESTPSSATIISLPAGRSDRNGTTPSLLRSPHSQARDLWNSERTRIVKDGRKGFSRSVPCYRLLLTVDGLLERSPGRWLDPPGCRTGRTDAYSCRLDYWHLRTLTQRSSQQSLVSVDPRSGGVSGTSGPFWGSREKIRRNRTPADGAASSVTEM